MDIIYTQGRKSLTLDTWHKAEASQGATNCAAAKLTAAGVLLGDTQNPDQTPLTFGGSAWASLLRATA